MKNFSYSLFALIIGLSITTLAHSRSLRVRYDSFSNKTKTLNNKDKVHINLIYAKARTFKCDTLKNRNDKITCVDINMMNLPRENEVVEDYIKVRLSMGVDIVELYGNPQKRPLADKIHEYLISKEKMEKTTHNTEKNDGSDESASTIGEILKISDDMDQFEENNSNLEEIIKINQEIHSSEE